MLGLLGRVMGFEGKMNQNAIGGAMPTGNTEGNVIDPP